MDKLMTSSNALDALKAEVRREVIEECAVIAVKVSQEDCVQNGPWARACFAIETKLRAKLAAPPAVTRAGEPKK